MLIWRRMEPLNRVGDLRIAHYARVELYGILGAVGRQTSFLTRIDIYGQNRPRNTVHRKFYLLIWHRVKPLNRVRDPRITR